MPLIVELQLRDFGLMHSAQIKSAIITEFPSQYNFRMRYNFIK